MFVVERLALSAGLSLVLAVVVGVVMAWIPMEYGSDSLPYSVVLQEVRANHRADGLAIPGHNGLTRMAVEVESGATVERGIPVIRR